MAEGQKSPDRSAVDTSGVEAGDFGHTRLVVWEDELEWMRSIANGDPLAIESLLDRYQQGIRNLVGRLTAWSSDVDDLTQEVFLKAWQRAAQFNRQVSLQNWLYTIAVPTRSQDSPGTALLGGSAPNTVAWQAS
jgi:hypothetical protein